MRYDVIRISTNIVTWSVCGAGPWHRRSWAEHRTEKLERYHGFPDLSQNFLNFIIGKGLHALNWVLHSLILKPMVVITPIMWLTPHWYPEHFQSWESWDVNGVNCGDLSITKKSGIVLGCGEFTKPGFLYHVCKAWFSTWNIKVEILRTRLCAKQPTFLMVGSANGNDTFERLKIVWPIRGTQSWCLGQSDAGACAMHACEIVVHSTWQRSFRTSSRHEPPTCLRVWMEVFLSRLQSLQSLQLSRSTIPIALSCCWFVQFDKREFLHQGTWELQF